MRDFRGIEESEPLKKFLGHELGTSTAPARGKQIAAQWAGRREGARKRERKIRIWIRLQLAPKRASEGVLTSRRRNRPPGRGGSAAPAPVHGGAAEQEDGEDCGS